MGGTTVKSAGPKSDMDALLWSFVLPLGGQLYAEDWPTFWVLFALMIGSFGILLSNGNGTLGGWAFGVVWFLGVLLNGRSCRRFNQHQPRQQSP